MTGHSSSGMDTEYRSRLVAHLLAPRDAPDTALLDQVQAIGVTAARHMLFDKVVRLQHTDLTSGDGLCRPGRPHRRADPTGVIERISHIAD